MSLANEAIHADSRRPTADVARLSESGQANTLEGPPTTAWRWQTLVLLGGISALYFLCTSLLAMRKPLWYDELVVLHVARLPALADLWSALRAGADFNPPLYHLATRCAYAVLGVGSLATRLPAMVGFWVMALSLFRFVARRCGPLYGWVGLLFPLTTGVYGLYAYEGRAYGVVLGCCGLALLCWQSAAEGERRLLALVGLALSLAAAVASHYYAVLLFIPLLLGEGIRCLTRKRVDVAMGIAFAAGLFPLVLLVPLIREAMAYRTSFWARPEWSALPRFYGLMLKTTLMPLGFAVLIWLVSRSRRRTLPSQERRLPRPPLHETVAALGLLALPVLGLIVAKLVTGVFTERYALSAMVGCSILVAFAADRLGRGSRVLGRALVVCLLGGFVAGVAWQFHQAEEECARLARVGEMLERTTRQSDLPLVAADELSSLQLAYYLPPELAARLVCLGNGTDNLRLKERFEPLQPSAFLSCKDYAPFVAAHPRFFVIKMNNGWGEWLVPALQADRRSVAVKAQEGMDIVYAVGSMR